MLSGLALHVILFSSRGFAELALGVVLLIDVFAMVAGFALGALSLRAETRADRFTGSGAVGVVGVVGVVGRPP